jgi:hypothetical protein
LSTGGSSNAIGSFFRIDARLSMHTRMAAMSPSLAISIALRAIASASPSSRFCMRTVTLLRDPRGRPDCRFGLSETAWFGSPWLRAKKIAARGRACAPACHERGS